MRDRTEIEADVAMRSPHWAQRLCGDVPELLNTLDELVQEDQLFPLTLDQRQRLHQLADDVYARHEQQHIPAIEECSFLECRMARVLGRGSN